MYAKLIVSGIAGFVAPEGTVCYQSGEYPTYKCYSLGWCPDYGICERGESW